MKRNILAENMRRFKTKNLKSNDKKLLNEYYIQAGDPYEDVYILNIFTDMLWDESIDKQPDMDGKKVQAVVKKYRPIAEKLWKQIEGLKGNRVNAEQAEEIEDVYYDGADAYDNEETFINDMPEYYDDQIEVLKRLGLEKKQSSKRQGPGQNPDRHKVNIDDIDVHSIEFEDVFHWDHPDYVDAFISYAEFEDGQPLNDDQLDWLVDNGGDWVYDRLQAYLY
jgi:hypothetical protein